MQSLHNDIHQCRFCWYHIKLHVSADQRWWCVDAGDDGGVDAGDDGGVDAGDDGVVDAGDAYLPHFLHGSKLPLPFAF